METPPFQARAVDLLLPAHQGVYEAQVKRIWWLLIPTRESMHMVNSISKFPLRKFVEPHDIGFFWNVLVRNCGDAVVLRLHSLLNDDGRDTLSLRKLANCVCTWLQPRYLDWYIGRLRDAKFDSRLNDIAARVRGMRHAIAHIFVDKDGIPTDPATGISDIEVEELYTATKQLFKTACLTEEFVIDQTDYCLADFSPRPMDRLLDLVAKDSNWVRMPELRKEWWPMRRMHMPEAELKELNEWRARFNLAPA